MRCCRTCGQSVESRDLSNHLTGIMLKIYRIVRSCGLVGARSDLILESVYTGPDGGPDVGTRVISAHVNHVNRKIGRFGQRIVGGRRGPKHAVFVLKENRERVFLRSH